MSRSAPLFALVGNPNAGKSTLFNALTGMRQKIGNYPGVTVEWKEGTFYSQHGKPMRLLDLPGSYSLNARSPDEQILVEALLGRVKGLPHPDGVICCLDASSLERNLFLATQVIDLGLPAIVVLNMMDVARRRGIKIDVAALSKRLGVPVIACEAAKGIGLPELRIRLSQPLVTGKLDIAIPALVAEAAKDLVPVLPHSEEISAARLQAQARYLLTTDKAPDWTGAAQTRIVLWHQRFDRELPGWRSELITSRYAWIGEVMRETVRRFNPNQPSWTERCDKVLLHPVSGFLVLFAVMGTLFFSIFTLAVPVMELLDGLFDWFGGKVAAILPDGQLQSLLVDGVIGGVGGVLIFLPQIILLFFFIFLLESTGYMARAAFILDRLMSKVGLHGRSFIPLLSSYACAVPGIMAARTIESPKDRLITILVAPFMTCSARLPVYLVLIAAMLPHDGTGGALLKSFLLLFLYFLGTVVALVCAWFFRKTLLRGTSPMMVMELPTYRLPQWGSVFRELTDRSWVFLKRAGTIIFALSIVLWFLMNYPRQHAAVDAADAAVAVASGTPAAAIASAEVEMLDSGLEASFAGRLGHFLEPVFAPLGYDWRITVGIIASFAAREVFVSTMAILYRVDADEPDSLVDTFRNATRSDGSPLFTPLTCLSILIFFVFALQCISTIAVVRRETHSWRWPAFQFAYMFAFAYILSALVFQGGQWLGFQ